ncbi:hypothetical protein [Micromonospora sp. RTP1Z1]|uniref:hypothetical protein n=1 Tax=Micromonospora sp. RTP1Z1 TaxID=2994043 RepID=UPI0029C7253E|nr:hypothetical protein [Micromonospora sp. RTP1Z1]
MGDQVGTREQPSDRDPGRLCAEHAYLLLAAVSLTAAIVAYIADSELPFDLNRGAYAIMVALFVAGYCGWLSRSAERRMRRELGAEHRRLATALEDLRDHVARQRVVHLPPAAKQCEGVRHLHAAVGGQDSPVPIGPQRVGLDPETIAAARALARRIADGPRAENQDG